MTNFIINRVFGSECECHEKITKDKQEGKEDREWKSIGQRTEHHSMR